VLVFSRPVRRGHVQAQKLYHRIGRRSIGPYSIERWLRNGIMVGWWHSHLTVVAPLYS